MNPVDDVIRIHARELKLPGVIRNFQELGRDARAHAWTHEEYLRENFKI